MPAWLLLMALRSAPEMPELPKPHSPPMFVPGPWLPEEKLTVKLSTPIWAVPPVITTPDGRSNEMPVRIWSELLNPAGTAVEVLRRRTSMEVGLLSVNCAWAPSPGNAASEKLKMAADADPAKAARPTTGMTTAMERLIRI